MTYYSGVLRRRPTISCAFRELPAVRAALLLALLAPGVLWAQSPPVEQPSLFPLGPVWGVKLPSAPSAPPAFDANQSYVALDTGEVVAVALTDGAVRWKAPLETRVGMAAGDDLLYVASGEAVHALSAADGNVVWRQPIGGVFSGPLTWDTGWLIASVESGDIVAINAKTGEIIWRASLGSPVRRPPLIDGPRVYLATDDARIVSLDIKTGQKIWERKLRGVAAAMLTVGNRMYVGGLDNLFYCISTKDGEVQWFQRTGADILGAPVADDKKVYVVSLDGLLRAYHRGHGAQIWKRAFLGWPSSGPILTGDEIILPGVPPELHAYSPKDGKPQATFAAPNLQPGTHQVLAAPPTIVRRPEPEGPTVLLLTREGQFFAVRRSYEAEIEPIKRLPGTALPVEPPPLLPTPPPGS